MDASKTRAGFTLVEILVVVCIVLILAGLTSVSVLQAQKFAHVKKTRTEIQLLAAAAHNYKTGFGDYPPTSFAHPPLKLKTNGLNEGNESLIGHLSARKHGGPFYGDFDEDYLENLDGDQLTAKGQTTVQKELRWTRGNAQLLEFVDYWGNPYVYIHYRDYKSRKKLGYVDSEGKTIYVEASKSAKTGAFQSPTSFQIWSFGPNRKNENGDGDDIVSWRQ